MFSNQEGWFSAYLFPAGTDLGIKKRPLRSGADACFSKVIVNLLAIAIFAAVWAVDTDFAGAVDASAGLAFSHEL